MDYEILVIVGEPETKEQTAAFGTRDRLTWVPGTKKCHIAVYDHVKGGWCRCLCDRFGWTDLHTKPLLASDVCRVCAKALDRRS